MPYISSLGAPRLASDVRISFSAQPANGSDESLRSHSQLSMSNIVLRLVSYVIAGWRSPLTDLSRYTHPSKTQRVEAFRFLAS